MRGIVAETVAAQRALARSKGQRFKVKLPPREAPPNALERPYRAFLTGVTRAVAADVRKLLFPLLDGLVREFGARADAAPYDLSDIEATLAAVSEELRGRVDNQHLRDLEKAVAKYRTSVSEHVDKQLRRQIRSMISLDAIPPAGTAGEYLLNSWVVENRKRIKALTDEEIAQVEDIVRRNTQAGLRADVIKKELMTYFPQVANRAALIARDQVNKLRGNLARVRQISLGLEQYIWRTSRDERVRNTHIVKEGRIFSWDDPPADTGHPGQDIQCRCSAEPYIEDEPPPKENPNEVIEEVLDKRDRLRKRLVAEGKASARLIPTKRPKIPPLQEPPKPKPKPEPKPKPKPEPKPKPKPKPKAPGLDRNSWKASLDAEEKTALKRWLTKDYAVLRDFDKHKDASKVPSWVPGAHKKMVAAIKRAPRYTGTVHRGLEGIDKKKLERLITEGHELSVGSISSWSKDLNVAERFAEPGGLGKPKGHRVILRAKTKKGAVDIDDLARDLKAQEEVGGAEEKEVLIERGRKFRVVKTTKREMKRYDLDVYVVDLEEI